MAFCRFAERTNTEEFLHTVIEPSDDPRAGLADQWSGHCAEWTTEEKSADDADNRVTENVFDCRQAAVENFAGAFDDTTDDGADCSNRVAAQQFAGAFDYATDDASCTANYTTNYVDCASNNSAHFVFLQLFF